MKKYLMLPLVLLLAACGFRLAGTDPALNPPLPYSTWSVQGNELQQAIETELLRRDAKIDNAFAQAGLRVTGIQANKDIQTLNLSGTVSEYRLELKVSAQAWHGEKALGAPINVTVYRTLDYSDSEILGKQEEEAQLWAEMRADAARQLVRRLGYLKAE
ncbi:hypothetical protein H9Q10_02460 [Eikenella sp. S3360]|uniref:LPS-assembly lipoprotein LptE n=1 Tax=Eikenella glucosivorans TaxID=2766967 RepID=A0ABS0N8A0_9NEIS|nr:LPS assembly lipoprotein LptE [Eikenella glucosivorans]MBH5328536.1 hypothetical protein [Eikenella glucosivorans]